MRKCLSVFKFGDRLISRLNVWTANFSDYVKYKFSVEEATKKYARSVEILKLGMDGK
jgi:hypothetical protein